MSTVRARKLQVLTPSSLNAVRRESDEASGGGMMPFNQMSNMQPAPDEA
jgi:hypothetical protein